LKRHFFWRKKKGKKKSPELFSQGGRKSFEFGLPKFVPPGREKPQKPLPKSQDLGSEGRLEKNSLPPSKKKRTPPPPGRRGVMGGKERGGGSINAAKNMHSKLRLLGEGSFSQSHWGGINLGSNMQENERRKGILSFEGKPQEKKRNCMLKSRQRKIKGKKLKPLKRKRRPFQSSKKRI